MRYCFGNFEENIEQLSHIHLAVAKELDQEGHARTQ